MVGVWGASNSVLNRYILSTRDGNNTNHILRVLDEVVSEYDMMDQSDFRHSRVDRRVRRVRINQTPPIGSRGVTTPITPCDTAFFRSATNCVTQHTRRCPGQQPPSSKALGSTNNQSTIPPVVSVHQGKIHLGCFGYRQE